MERNRMKEKTKIIMISIHTYAETNTDRWTDRKTDRQTQRLRG